MYTDTLLKRLTEGRKLMRPPSPDAPRQRGPFLIQPWLAIGDTVFALEVAERIWDHSPHAAIDVFLTPLQQQIFADHPQLSSRPPETGERKTLDRTGIRIISIPQNIYDGSPAMREVCKELASRLPKYETIFIEDPVNAHMLFSPRRYHQHYTYNNLRQLELHVWLQQHCPLPLPFLNDVPKYRRTRALVDTYFGSPHLQESDKTNPITLYLSNQRIRRAKAHATFLKDQAGRKNGTLLLINPDTSSPVTRPPTDLLIAALAPVLRCHPHIVMGILPGYTDPSAHENLYHRLVPHFGSQIQYTHTHSYPKHLLDTTALLDQADIFVTGDTGLMHLALTDKVAGKGDGYSEQPRNTTHVITIWGGTRPSYWGYPGLSVIIGEGNPLQRRMYPGIRKYQWITNTEADYFGHIAPHEMTNAIRTAIARLHFAEK